LPHRCQPPVDRSPAVRALRLSAEQALLGAVLSDPAGQVGVLDLVAPEDMSRPWHGQVLAAMQRLRQQHTPPGPQQVRQELLADPDLPSNVALDAIPLVDLLEAAPHPRHTPAYAALVIEGSIRERIWLAGSRMTQAADGDSPGPALHAARQAARDVQECQARWEALPASIRRELPAPACDHEQYTQIARQTRAVREEIARLRENLWAESPRDVEERLAAIAQHLAETAAASATLREQQAAGHAADQARPDSPAAHVASSRALRDLAAAPDQINAVRGWLRPGHFARSEHGDLYAVMRDLQAAGKPADPVTTGWEAARRGIPATRADLTGGNAALAVASAREVHRHGLLAHATQTATCKTRRPILAAHPGLCCDPPPNGSPGSIATPGQPRNCSLDPTLVPPPSPHPDAMPG
jgi:replicative DNA helicase